MWSPLTDSDLILFLPVFPTSSSQCFVLSLNLFSPRRLGSFSDWRLLGPHQHSAQVHGTEAGSRSDLSSMEGGDELCGGHPGRGGIR